MHALKKISLRSGAFTLVEILTATAIFALMMSLLFSALSEVNSAWQRADSQKSRRQNGRAILNIIGQDMQSIVMPLSANGATPVSFEMNPSGFNYKNRDAVFWQTASSFQRQTNDICTVGYFIRTIGNIPSLCRLYANGALAQSWFQADILAPGDSANDYKGLLAENVLALYVTLYNRANTVVAAPGQSYSAANASSLPGSADVAVVIADPQAVRRFVGPNSAAINPIPVANDATVEEYFKKLPDALRSRSEIFRARIQFPPSSP